MNEILDDVEIEELEKQIRQMKSENEKDKRLNDLRYELKKLRKQIFRNKHPYLMSAGNVIETASLGLFKFGKKTGNKISQGARNYERNTRQMEEEQIKKNENKINPPSQQINKKNNQPDYFDILP
jgi:hypothetical protein